MALSLVSLCSANLSRPESIQRSAAYMSLRLVVGLLDILCSMWSFCVCLKHNANQRCVYAVYIIFVIVCVAGCVMLTMVPSCVAGSRLLTSWVPAGYRMTYNLITGSRSRTPIGVLVFYDELD